MTCPPSISMTLIEMRCVGASAASGRLQPPVLSRSDCTRRQAARIVRAQPCRCAWLRSSRCRRGGRAPSACWMAHWRRPRVPMPFRVGPVDGSGSRGLLRKGVTHQPDWHSRQAPPSCLLLTCITLHVNSEPADWREAKSALLCSFSSWSGALRLFCGPSPLKATAPSAQRVLLSRGFANTDFPDGVAQGIGTDSPGA